MIYSVSITKQAEDDLRRIYTYIAVSLQSPENASAQLERLEDKIESLDNLPKRFPVYKKEIRFMPVDNYLVFYTADDSSEDVSVLRVMYCRRDYNNLV